MLTPVLVMQFDSSIIQASFELMSFIIFYFAAAKRLHPWFRLVADRKSTGELPLLKSPKPW
jgi:hypothetical protein